MDLLDPDIYAERGYPHEAWTRLRRESPVHWVEREDDVPYWAILRHADIIWISRQPERFRNTPRFEASLGGAELSSVRTVINMDPPEHAAYRRLVSRRFTPRALRGLRGDIERIAAEILDDVAADGEWDECEFVERVAAPLPIAVIAWLLGLPRADWPDLFRWTSELVGASDTEYQRDGENLAETVRRSRGEIFEYFSRLSEERRRSPRDDLVSLLASAEIESERIGDPELLSYYLILVAAGNETTRNATSGGMLAFIEHPEQWHRLQRDESLLETAVEEILRWTSPVIHMARTAAHDAELGGRKIRAGDTLAMFYPSSNRDEELFDEPFAFRSDRRPNRHLSFGVGEHFCVGAHLARLELQAAFRQLARRLDAVELAGPVERLRSPNVGGIKRLPIRFKLREAS